MRKPTQKDKIKEYIRQNGYNRNSTEIGQKLGANPRRVREVVTEINLQKEVAGAVKSSQGATGNYEFEQNDKGAELTYNTTSEIDHIDDAELIRQAIKESNVDENIWRVETYRVSRNQWDMAYKSDLDAESWKDDKGLWHRKEKWGADIKRSYQFSVRIFFKRKVIERIIEELTKSTIAEMEKHSPVYPKVKYEKTQNGQLGFVSLTDMHIGKLAIEEECGESYNIEDAVNLRNCVIDIIAEDMGSRPIDRILYIVGNDDSHYDNRSGTTTKGTPVDTDGTLSVVTNAIKQSHVRSIDILREIAPVDVISCLGNHDEHVAYFVGQILAAWYRKDKSVTVNADWEPQKYYSYGATMFMITHGRYEKRANLPLIMATDEAVQWGQAKFREIMTGDLHHKKDVNYIGTEDMQGIVVRILPTLAGTDYWHKQRGYKSVRAAEIFYYDKNFGLDGTKFIPAYSMGKK